MKMMKCLYYSHTTLLIIIFGSIIGLFLIFSKQQPARKPFTTSAISCYHVQDASLPDISNIIPAKGKSIFFHETSCRSHINGKITISARQACAVESAARMNPHLDVYLLFASPGQIKNENTTSDRFLKALLTYKSIKILHLDYGLYIKNTPLEDLYESGKLESSKYSLSHASDVLRYLTLWKYGGIYLDLDVIVVKSLENLSENYAGSESEEHVAAGVLKFAPTGNGHHFAELCVEDLKYHFSGSKWGYNGPGVITRLLKKICNANTAKEMLNQSCSGFTVYPPKFFYPVPWRQWKTYFDSKMNNKIMNIIKDSYVVHVWNRFSEQQKISLNYDVPYTILAKRYCPKVIAECEYFF
ncbi:hypothetical protein ILUMI_00120 [Ignelater luminosus]|uniref:Alpha 1,4-glycosyltransferase domain-containing protein n=1 Tax=Ignelater luminosus TaxID=2038154 RepID=A0A8K0GLK2_IGNLU|nr:hypothetical protein ILUMI_00120 [Ignelater luminosus]